MHAAITMSSIHAYVYMYIWLSLFSVLLNDSTRIWLRQWPFSVWCSTVQTSLTSWRWQSSSRAWPALGPGRALTSSTASTLKCSLSSHSRSQPSNSLSNRGWAKWKEGGTEREGEGEKNSSLSSYTCVCMICLCTYTQLVIRTVCTCTYVPHLLSILKLHCAIGMTQLLNCVPIYKLYKHSRSIAQFTK